jgi:probable addiction module antidote protein
VRRDRLSGDYHEALIKHLKDPAEQAAYLNAVLAEGDRKLLLKALRNVAEANGGIQRLATRSRLSRENLYRMLSDKGNPELSSLDRIMRSLGLSFRVEPVRKHASAH